MTFREITPPLASKSTKKQASASTHENPQKTNKKTKTQQQKTNAEDGDQASGGKPKEQSETKKDGSAVIYQVGTDNIITEATQHLSNRLKFKHGEGNVVVVTKNKEGLLKIQGDTSKLKPGYKVKITGHIKGIGDKATMEGNTSEQLSEDLVTILPEGNSPRKVSVVGCGSGKCDKNNNSFASNLQKNLQKKDVITTVKGYSKDISMSVKGKVLQGEQASADKKMMEEGDTGDTAEQEKIDLEAEGIRLKKEQEKAELEAEGTRLKNEEEKIRNKQVEDEKALRLLEGKLEKAASKWRESHRSFYKVKKTLSEINKNILDTRIKILILEEFGDLEKLMESRNHLKQQNDRRIEAEKKVAKQKINDKEVMTLNKQFVGKYDEHLSIKAQLKEIIGKEEENTRKKLEKVREDIKEDSQGQGLSAESDKTNQEKLKLTLQALEEEIKVINQKKQVMLKGNLLMKMIDLQRSQTNDELTKILFKEIRQYREEEVKQWTDVMDANPRPDDRLSAKNRLKKAKRLKKEISRETLILQSEKGQKKANRERKLSSLKADLEKAQNSSELGEGLNEGATLLSDFKFDMARSFMEEAIEDRNKKEIYIRNLESRLTNQNKQMDDLEQKLQSITANKEAQNTDHDNNTLREIAQQAIMRQEENEAIDELLE
ncbi:hypothetical protein, partial [uncultured Gammaproteobacteria bacterium]